MQAIGREVESAQCSELSAIEGHEETWGCAGIPALIGEILSETEYIQIEWKIERYTNYFSSRRIIASTQPLSSSNHVDEFPTSVPNGRGDDAAGSVADADAEFVLQTATRLTRVGDGRGTSVVGSETFEGAREVVDGNRVAPAELETGTTGKSEDVRFGATWSTAAMVEVVCAETMADVVAALAAAGVVLELAETGQKT